MKHIAIIGVGLIGGSMAMDIKRLSPESKIFALDNNNDHIAQAKTIGFVDEAIAIEDLNQADLVIVAIPVDATVDLLSNILDNVSDHTLVMDVGSTKYDICKAVENHPRRRNFLATHPIAGTEFSGPKAAVKGLFEGKTNIKQ